MRLPTARDQRQGRAQAILAPLTSDGHIKLVLAHILPIIERWVF
jgi:hypothetical protein